MAPGLPSYKSELQNGVVKFSPTTSHMRLRALDLFCCAGGASMGLHRAGFEVVGVDINPQPNYPFEFHQADAMTYPLEGFDFIWASPPCQKFTALQNLSDLSHYPDLIDPIRKRLRDAERTRSDMKFRLLWTIENVMGAPVRGDLLLCGSMFGLSAQGCRLQRHRLFECNFLIEQFACKHDARPVIGVYGGHARRRAASAGGRGSRDIWKGGHKIAASEAMGIDWMTCAEMSEAIPPAYAEYIGRRVFSILQSEEGLIR